MRGSKRYWLLLLTIAMLPLSGCTENDIDESEADVFLQITSLDAPAVVAGEPEGTCQAAPTVECNQDSDCLNGVCDLILGSGCDIPFWKMDFKVFPLTDAALESNLNNVLLNPIIITYTGGAPGPFAVGGASIEVGGNGSVTFKPIQEQDLTVDAVSLPLTFTFSAHTVNGNTVEVFGVSVATLAIEECGL